MFDRLRQGDIVRWSPAVEENWEHLPYGHLWDGEPKCPMEVITYINTSEETLLELDCLNGCGAHVMVNLDRDEYEAVEDVIGTDALEIVNLTSLPEMLQIPGEKEDTGYNLEADEVILTKMIEEGKIC